MLRVGPSPTKSGLAAIRFAATIRFAASSLLVVALAGCGGGVSEATPPAVRSASPTPSLDLIPALDLIPGGASLVLRAKLKRLFRHPTTAPVLEALFPTALRDRFARRTGIEIDQVDEVVYAEFDRGDLAIAHGTWPAADVVRGASVRMNTVEVRAASPRERRAGYIGSERYDLVAIDEHRVMVARGHASLVPMVLSRLDTGTWPEGHQPSLDRATMGGLVFASRDSDAVLFGPGPPTFSGGRASKQGARALLGAIRAFSVAFRPLETGARGDETRTGVADATDGELAVEVECRGDFPSTAAGNFRNLVHSVAETDLGSALGMNHVPDSLQVQANDGGVALSFRLNSRRLSWGLRVLLGGVVERLLREP